MIASGLMSILKVTEILEKVQRRTTKMIKGLVDTLHSERSKEVSLLNLSKRRQRDDSISL